MMERITEKLMQGNAKVVGYECSRTTPRCYANTDHCNNKAIWQPSSTMDLYVHRTDLTWTHTDWETKLYTAAPGKSMVLNFDAIRKAQAADDEDGTWLSAAGLNDGSGGWSRCPGEHGDTGTKLCADSLEAATKHVRDTLCSKLLWSGEKAGNGKFIFQCADTTKTKGVDYTEAPSAVASVVEVKRQDRIGANNIKKVKHKISQENETAK